MLDKVLRFFITFFLAAAGAALGHLAWPLLTEYISTEVLSTDLGIFQLTAAGLVCLLVGALAGAAAGFFCSPFLLRQLRRFTVWVEQQFNKMPLHDVIAGTVGLAIGLIIANLLGYSFAKIPVIGDYIPVIFSIVLGYLGIYITIKKRQELEGMFDFFPRLLKEHAKNREAKQARAQEQAGSQAETAGAGISAGKEYKLLDTSVIIDGRIADICETGFIEGTLLIPVFVLEELQHIADSADQLKRVRGRRGLDILAKIRGESKKLAVEVTSKDYEDIAEVDSKLVRLGQEEGGKIITNDFNLNKVAQLRGVEVLNINELANAVKPVVIPGEDMQVTIVKAGKEPGQGVAYLDDGTMIVVENGYHHIGEDIAVEVTSALQTAAGRMIFSKPKR